MSDIAATDRCKHCFAEFAEHDYVPDSIDRYRCPYPKQETGYGAFKGGDPNNFFPDAECCTEEERKNHRRACLEWDGEDEPFPGCGKSPYGIGTYVTEWFEEFELLERDDDDGNADDE